MYGISDIGYRTVLVSVSGIHIAQILKNVVGSL